ncbi:hypothetical protein B0T11DRAFT_351691 [Plectosphaerella cucumerina]|uniref:Uncharacterized protein n=1 Tax=Plectosphaerella cucumerina TaxID=40658 RepID=A0A8K0TE78_9PEZI|nr:hypothetical protein B0T11DRAFT_351691 [Plectosphaerella cucumerina]
MRASSNLLATVILFPTVFAEYRPREHVVFFDCGFAANGDSAAQYMAYYPDIPWDSNNKFKDPDMLQRVPWDGAYPWRNVVPPVTMSNGDVFNFGIGNQMPDIDEPPHEYAGFGNHKYGDNAFMCYSWHERKAYYLKDEARTECGTAYICHNWLEPSSPVRKGKGNTSPGGGGGGGGPVEYERKATLTIESETTTVSAKDSNVNSKFSSLLSPTEVFGTLSDAFEGQRCKSKRYPISEQCSIGYECTLVGEGDDLAARQNAIAALLKKAAGDTVAGTEFYSTTYSSQWGIPTYHKSYKYPQTGGILIEGWQKGHQGAGTFIQADVSFNIQCVSASWFCRSGCDDIALAMVALGYSSRLVPLGVFGTLGAGTCRKIC